MQTPESKHTFCFNFIYTFKVLNAEIREDELIKTFEANNNLITTYAGEKLIIKDYYKEFLSRLEKDFAEKTQAINESVKQEIGDKFSGLSIKFKPLSHRLDETLLTQMNIASVNEKRQLGKEYKQFGLRPFLLSIDNSFLKGTAILSYLGSNIFSIQVIAFDKDYKLNFDEAVYLSSTYFKDCEVYLADNNIALGKGILSLIEAYKHMISQSFRNGLVFYYCKSYEVLVGVDFWTDDNRDIFYFLHQPLPRYRLSSVNSNYIDSVLVNSELSHFNDIKINACTHRMLICTGELYKFVSTNTPNFDNELIEKFTFDQQVQSIVPLQRALGSYCFTDNLLNIFREKTYFSIKELETVKITLKLSLKQYLLDEDYVYSTVNEMIEKIRAAIGYNILNDRLETHIDSINTVLDEKNKENNERARNTLTSFLGMLSVVAGIAAIDNWIKLLQRMGLEYPTSHPLRLTLILWVLLFIVAFLMCYRLIRKKDIRMNFSNQIFKNFNKLLMNIKVKRK